MTFENDREICPRCFRLTLMRGMRAIRYDVKRWVCYGLGCDYVEERKIPGGITIAYGTPVRPNGWGIRRIREREARLRKELS